MNAYFYDRHDAGKQLAARLRRREGAVHTVVLGIPRGGIPVAYEIAVALNAPLDIFIVRKLGTPRNAELAMGAIAGHGVRVLNKAVIRAQQISEVEIATTAVTEERELARQEWLFRQSRPEITLKGKEIVLVDDGLATGASMRAAVLAIRAQKPRSICVAVPVASSSSCKVLRQEVDELLCLETPEPFHAVGLWYEEFEQTTDHEVQSLIRRAGDLPRVA